MVDISRIREIRKNGVNSAKPQDIHAFYNILAEHLNSNSNDIIQNTNITIALDIDGEASTMIIKNGEAKFIKEKVEDADFQLFSDLKTMAAIASGLLNAQKAFLAGNLEIDGNFNKMLEFIEILEIAFQQLGIASKHEFGIIVDAITMKKLYQIYESGATEIDTSNIPVFLNIFCAFINLNDEARDIIETEDFRIQMIIKDIGPYLIYKDQKDGQVKWINEKVDNAILEFEVAIKTAVDVLLGGDAASAYLSGEVTAKGNIAQSLILQELLELFLEILPFTG